MRGYIRVEAQSRDAASRLPMVAMVQTGDQFSLETILDCFAAFYAGDVCTIALSQPGMELEAGDGSREGLLLEFQGEAGGRPFREWLAKVVEAV